MKSVNSFFENKILFGIGRYFWNLSAIAGFLAILGGGIIFIDSFEKEILTFPEWRDGQGENSKESFYDYEKRLKDFNRYVAPKNREDSQFLVLGGFGTIIISSSMSAFYAIERNTRKKEDK